MIHSAPYIPAVTAHSHMYAGQRGMMRRKRAQYAGRRRAGMAFCRALCYTG